MGKTKHDKSYIFDISIKSNSFGAPIGIKTPFLRVSVTIEPVRSLLTVHYHELFGRYQH